MTDLSESAAEYCTGRVPGHTSTALAQGFQTSTALCDEDLAVARSTSVARALPQVNPLLQLILLPQGNHVPGPNREHEVLQCQAVSQRG